MQRTGTVPVAMCFWPGLTRLWFQGQWSALGTAIGFACLLNFGLVFSFVWPEAVHPHVCLLVWTGTVLLWALSGWRQYRERETLLSSQSGPSTNHDALLFEAQCEYLAGRMDDSVNLLERILFANPRDAEARLLLATIMRRQQRFEESDDQLVALQKYDGAVKWVDEIDKEAELLQQAEDEAEENQHNSDLTPESTPTAIPEKSELATIESSQPEPIAVTEVQDRASLDQVSVKTSEPGTSDEQPKPGSSAGPKLVTAAGDGLSVSERFALQVSEISTATSLSKPGKTKQDGKQDRTDAA